MLQNRAVVGELPGIEVLVEDAAIFFPVGSVVTDTKVPGELNPEDVIRKALISTNLLLTFEERAS